MTVSALDSSTERSSSGEELHLRDSLSEDELILRSDTSRACFMMILPPTHHLLVLGASAEHWQMWRPAAFAVRRETASQSQLRTASQSS